MDMRVTTQAETLPQASLEHSAVVNYWVDMNALLTRQAPHSDSARAQMLADMDREFGLHTGSHADVCEYVVYYHQLLAFFADGTSTGLRNPGQLVALTGSKLNPTSLLLSNADGHVEIELTQRREPNRGALANLLIEVRASDGRAQLRPRLPALARWLTPQTDAASVAESGARRKSFRTVNGEDYTTHNRQWC